MAKFGERTFEKKLVGIVSFKSNEKRVKFTLTEEGKTFNGGSKSVTLNIADLPKPRVKPNSEGQVRVRMSADGTEMEAITPVVGVFNLELVDLGPRPDGEDSDPTPRVRTWNEGTPKENSYLEFFGVYEITEGKYKGVRLPAYNMHYKFEEDLPANPGFTRFAGNFNSKKATRLFQLRDWGNLHGVWEVTPDGIEGDPIEWNPDDADVENRVVEVYSKNSTGEFANILPDVLERALGRPSVRGVIKDGYISELLPLEDEDIEPFGDENDDIPNDDPNLDDASEIELDEEPKKTKSKANGKVATTGGVKKIKKIKKSKSDEDDDL